MALTSKEKTELVKLIAKTTDKDGKPLPDADADDLKRINDLFDKQGEAGQQQSQPKARHDKKHKLTREAEELQANGAEYLGYEERQIGTPEKPRLQLREYFYRNDSDGKSEAVMVQDGRVIGVGRKFADKALERMFA